MSAEPDGFEEFRRVRDLNAERDKVFAALLEFAERMANHKSARLHGFNSAEIQHARHVVKIAGGRLDSVGRYKEGEALPMTEGDLEKLKSQRFLARMKAEGMVWSEQRAHWVTLAMKADDDAAIQGEGI